MKKFLQVRDNFQALFVVAQKFFESLVFQTQEFARGKDLKSPILEELAKIHGKPVWGGKGL
jgi:hypothetical protein